MASLKDRTLSGVFWSFLQKMGASGIQFLVMIILARLLTPADFGLMGMLAIFIALSQTLMQAGFSEALIQKKDADEEDFSSVFYINLVASILLYLILFFCAPLIADFYQQPKLINITRVLSLIFIINAFGYVQETRLRRNLDFKKLMFIHLPSTIISGIVSVIMAYTGFGVWAIVAQQIIMRFAFTIQLWIYSKWRPLRTFNKNKAKKLFSFGSKLMLSGIISTTFDNIYQIVIGRFFPAQMLGFYENADKLTKTPTNTISNVLNSVAFPAFSQVQDDNEKLREGYKKIMQQVIFWLAPTFIVAIVLAEPLFRFVLGEKWLPAVPFFQILAIGRIISPLTKYNLSLVNVKGRSDIYLRLEIIKKIILAIGVFIAFPFGVIGLVWFKLGYVITVYFINSSYSGRFINYSTWKQIKDILPILGLTAILAIFTFGIDYIINDSSDIIRLIIGGVLSVFLFLGMAHVIKLEPYQEFRNIILHKFAYKLLKK